MFGLLIEMFVVKKISSGTPRLYHDQTTLCRHYTGKPTIYRSIHLKFGFGMNSVAYLMAARRRR